VPHTVGPTRLLAFDRFLTNPVLKNSESLEDPKKPTEQSILSHRPSVFSRLPRHWKCDIWSCAYQISFATKLIDPRHLLPIFKGINPILGTT
jgi:hypothetical protein